MSSRDGETTKSPSSSPTAKIVVVGCGWWSQGWHLPHLRENKDATIVALVDASLHPASSLNPDLVSMQTLSKMYGNVPVFTSVEDVLLDTMLMDKVDGILVATPHATHGEIGKRILEYSRNKRQSKQPIHIMMEKPMTTCVDEAKELYDAVVETEKQFSDDDVIVKDDDHCTGRPSLTFLVNHSANFRKQCLTARSLVLGSSKTIGNVQHIAASFASPLMWIFDNPANPGWNEPTHKMLGNGFAWGQQSHLLAWIYYVTDITPIKVSCHMHHSSKTGADLSHAATIFAKREETSDEDVDVVVMSLSGTTLLPGNEHSKDEPVGKEIHICIYGSEGAIRYCGTHPDPTSGQLELRRSNVQDGHPTFPCQEDGFQFENTDSEGDGPESLKAFIAACQGKVTDDGVKEKPAAVVNAKVGLRTIQTLDAMYRSHHSGQIENVKYV